MATIMLVRHADKGNGANSPKHLLSPKGEADARALGANLPESMKGAPISYIGGSIHSRSVLTAMLIAVGAGADPAVLPSMIELGSEKQFWTMTSKELFNTALNEAGGNMMLATRACLSTGDYILLKKQIKNAMVDIGNSLNGNVVLGTHNPWIQLFYEEIIGKEYNGNAAELSYIVADINGEGLISLVETNLP